jgi:formylglycine-generating enzyme required for sulfatase activity
MTPATRIGRFEILRELGRGGMGLVLEGRDPHLDRRVALKVLAPHAAHQPEFVERFLREGRLAAALSHPNVVTIYEAGEADGRYYIAMEFVEGSDLAGLLRSRGKLPLPAVLQVLAQAAAALDAAHDRGIIHRDLKPHNLLIDARGRVKVADFGIARALAQAGGTMTGTVLGTPEYLAPEQALGQPVSPRTDIYSLACVTYELLTGEPPFGRAGEGRPSMAVLYAHVNQPPPFAGQHLPELPHAVSRAVQRALAKDPEQRPASASAFLAELRSAVGQGAVIPASAAPPAALMPSVEAIPPGEPRAGEIRINPVDGAEMVWVPPGEFMMGSTPEEISAVLSFARIAVSTFELSMFVNLTANERPAHRVRITRGFWLYRNPVTNGQYGRFCRETGHRAPEVTQDGKTFKPAWADPDLNGDLQPVVGVTWDDAAAYCEWSGGRLPTEAEWEYAARGPESRLWPWGHQAPDASRAVFGFGFVGGKPAAVGGRTAGASWCGALDMAGNVWDWCADWYDENYYGQSPSVDPPGPSNGDARVVRGSDWRVDPYNLHVSWRVSRIPDNRNCDLGFRVARIEVK